MIPTYEEQLSLVDQGYAKKSTNGFLDTFKYSRRVMYKYLWEELKDKGILECRGHTYDNRDGKLVTLPLTKSFNYLELDTWKDVPLDTPVLAYKKYNGFMVAATQYEKELVVSTTGTTNSNYARYVKENHHECLLKSTSTGVTSLYECVADFDPHIVQEQEGLKMLGVRSNLTGEWVPITFGDTCTLGDVLERASTEKHEGWMVYTIQKGSWKVNGENFCKIKTDYYVGKKKLMRMKSVSDIWDKTRTVENNLPQRWKHAVECIKSSFKEKEWGLMSDQERRKFLETIED